MPINEKIVYIHEPTSLQCGQAVLAMITGVEVTEVIKILANEKETNLKEMKLFLDRCGIHISSARIPVRKREELPEVALLSLETPRCWHWSLYACGKFYDPEHGEMDDFPESDRKYYWKLENKE